MKTTCSWPMKKKKKKVPWWCITKKSDFVSCLSFFFLVFFYYYCLYCIILKELIRCSLISFCTRCHHCTWGAECRTCELEISDLSYSQREPCANKYYWNAQWIRQITSNVHQSVLATIWFTSVVRVMSIKNSNSSLYWRHVLLRIIIIILRVKPIDP